MRAVIRVCTTNPRIDAEYNKLYKSIKKGNDCIVRLYCIKAQNLQPKDLNGFADPYIVCSLGTKTFSDTKHRQKGTLNPDLFTHFEFPVISMPGPSLLNVKVMDYNNFTSPELIGETTIDLEERW